jgi:hypothetical protein
MSRAPRNMLLGFALALSCQMLRAQQRESVTITEPGIIKLTDLFEMSDAVALVRIVSGDAEGYETAVYKAKLVQSFKGPTTGEIYFGPYIGSKLGGEYVLFLRKPKEPSVPKSVSKSNYGTVSIFQVFNQGYSAMEASYECVFNAKDIADKCAYGVKVCTDYVVLPKSLPVFPPLRENVPFGCRWVRREPFLATLTRFRDSRK